MNVVRKDKIKQVDIETVDTFRVLGLAMRHKISIQVESECLEMDGEDLLKLYPAFRPVHELLQDAKVMDGFIPSMFEEAKRQQQQQQQQQQQNKQEEEEEEEDCLLYTSPSPRDKRQSRMPSSA